MKTTSQAYSLIKSHEGCELESYLDKHDRWAIGYGVTGKGIAKGLRITQHEAELMLANRVTSLEDQVTDLVNVPLTQPQFDALVSLTYNIGIGAFSTSTLLRLLNNKQYSDAAREILKWDHSGGKTLPGLTSRRLAEFRLFNS